MARLQVGYYRSLANFLTFSLLMFTISLAMSSHFRLLALLAPDETIAYPLGSLLSLALVITSGFTITRGGRTGAGQQGDCVGSGCLRHPARQ
jgi:ABC-type multidrug transport system permease subunit